MSLLPIFINDTLNDGSYIHLLPFCKNNHSKGKCAEYYKIIRDGKIGLHCCPYGLSSYVFAIPNDKIIFSGLRIRENYDKKKAKAVNTTENIYNPVITEENFLSIAHDIAVTIDEKYTLQKKLDAINDLLHETRSLNGQVKSSIDLLWETHPDENEIEYEELLLAIKNAHVSSHLISNRFAYFDSILNPTLTSNSPYSVIVFRKFDKMRKLLKGYMRKNVWISLNSPGQCDYSYDILQTFETLLFILLENAVKYSVPSRSVDVNFYENGNILDVSIESLGPYSDENELLHLCEKGYRGENAKAIQPRGQGFGLNFAKKICDDHNIRISFNSVYSHKDHGIKYGTFFVKLHFEK